MKHESAPTHLQLRAFAQGRRQLSGHDPIACFPRIMDETGGRAQDVVVTWTANGDMRTGGQGEEQVWLHLQADTTVPLLCQRCLDVVQTRLPVDRWFRFVADEETAAAEDDDAAEDLLVFAGDFDLRELIEDELVLELPLIPRHDVCPATVPVDPPGSTDAASKRPNPFAALAGLKPGTAGHKK